MYPLYEFVRNSIIVVGEVRLCLHYIESWECSERHSLSRVELLQTVMNRLCTAVEDHWHQSTRADADAVQDEQCTVVHMGGGKRQILEWAER